MQPLKLQYHLISCLEILNSECLGPGNHGQHSTFIVYCTLFKNGTLLYTNYIVKNNFDRTLLTSRNQKWSNPPLVNLMADYEMLKPKMEELQKKIQVHRFVHIKI